MSRVLVVDDNPDFLQTIGGLLDDEGHEVKLAAKEGEALQAMLESSFDVAIVDVCLHGNDPNDESGIALALALKSLNPRVRFILITGQRVSSEQVVRATRYYGAASFVDKNAQVGTAILNALEQAGKETGPVAAERTGTETLLTFSLIPDHPLYIRSRGRFVNSTPTQQLIDVDVVRYAQLAEAARKGGANMHLLVQTTGDELWEHLFKHKECSRAYFEARGGKGNELAIVFETPREYIRLPLEFMRPNNSEDWLILQHPVVRFVYDAVPHNEAISPSALARTGHLRVLLIASNTWTSSTDAIPGVEKEVKAVKAYLETLKPPFKLEVTALMANEATYERIEEELQGPYDIIHYAGHGSFSSQPGQSSVYFWSGQGKKKLRQVTATEINGLLDTSVPRLVYLSCCCGMQTAGATALLDDDFLGLADAVVHAGVPTVVGFRWPVSDEGASRLAKSFYRSLFKQGNPAIALWRARCDLARWRMNDPTWLSPILIHQG